MAAKGGCWRNVSSPSRRLVRRWSSRRHSTPRPDLASAYGELEQAVSFEEQAIEIYETLDEPVRRSTALVFLGTLYRRVGRTDGRETLERGLAGLEAAGDEYGVTIAKGNLSDFALYDGDFATAALLGEQSATTPATMDSSSSKRCRRSTRLSRSSTTMTRAVSRSRAPRSACALEPSWSCGSDTLCFAVAAAVAPLEPERGSASPRSC